MKREWVRPQTLVQSFAANEYVAACGDENKVYKFTCDAPGGTLYYYPNGDGTIDGEYTGNGDATRLGNYHPCGSTHEASVTNAFYDGFVDRNGNRRQDDGEGVIVWRGPYNNNGHATANLDMNSWVTAKS